MSLRFALLGLLDDGPASGYELTARFDRSLRKYAWTAQQSHVYPELARLADQGLIEVHASGPRGRRSYALTATGRAALREWLLRPAAPAGVRDERTLRMMLLSALTPEEARARVHDYLAEARRQSTELTALAAAADADEHPRGRLRFGRLALELGIQQAQAQEQWARWALAQLDAA